MCNKSARSVAISGVVSLLIIAWNPTTVFSAGSEDEPPSPEKVVLQHFAKLRGYRPGDIISAGDVKPVLKMLENTGFGAADRKEILADVPGDGDLLVKSLRTKAGRRFMREVAKYPGAYDRLDRLVRMPQGKATLQALIGGPDGYKMVEYLTTTRGGANLGKQLSNTPKGGKFNSPTGRIYTVEMLLARLKTSHAAATGKHSTRFGGSN